MSKKTKSHKCYTNEDEVGYCVANNTKDYFCPKCQKLVKTVKLGGDSDRREKMNSYIWITTEREGFHKWKNAPKEVAFLKYPHRHMFYFRVFIEIFGDDREIEFISFKWHIEKMLDAIWKSNNLDSSEKTVGLSCEMISDLLYKKVSDLYPGRTVIIDASEDGENGSRKEYLFI